jgi:diguanylate cyclase (GGDEF)-like protein
MEIRQGLPLVLMITAGAIVASFVLTTAMMTVVGFHDARLHYVLAATFPTIITPLAAYPLVIGSHRLRQMKLDLERLLRLDGLTAIPNRRAFFERAADVFARKSTTVAMMIDIDHFKRVNDAYGHAVGDMVLSEVGHTIERFVAAVPQGGERITARIGGEEFAVLIEGVGLKDACRLAQAIVDQVRAAPIVAGSYVIPITVSIGVAARSHEESADQLLRLADCACYRAKRQGRDRFCQTEPSDRPCYEGGALGPVRKLAAVG